MLEKLELFYPISPFTVNQKFGDSSICVEDNETIPIQKRKKTGKINGVCQTGYKDLYQVLGMKGHNGLDVFAKHGQALYYCGPNGFVQEIETEIERGLGLGIVSGNKYDFGSNGIHYVKTRYWHLQGLNVKIEDEIKTGDLIGWCDNTGISTGDHLHFELKPVERDSFGQFTNVLQGNGYYGAVDPAPYFNGYLAKDATKVKSILNSIIAILEQMQEILKGRKT